jgi:hypothetical protein
MKRVIFCGLLTISLVACSGTYSDNGGCSSNGDGEVCIKIRAQEPIHFMEPIDIIMTITSDMDISGLGISLIIWPHTIIVGEAEGQEQGIELWKGESGINWRVNINTGEIITLTRKIYLPAENGAYQLIVYASTPQLRAVDSMYFHQTGEAVNIYLSGTKIPITQGPLPTIGPELLETLHAVPTLTRFPTLTPKPTKTSTPTSQVYPPPATPPWDNPYP